MTLRMTMALVLLIAGLAGAETEIVGTVKATRSTAPNEPGRENLVVVGRDLSLGEMSISYRQLVDPAQGDKPVVQRYGDYRLGCAFPLYSWNWDLEYFLDVTVTRGQEKPFVANRAAVQEGIYLLEQGPRGIADMVWPLPGETPSRVVVRLLRVAGKPQWMYLRVTLEGDPTWRLTQVRLGSYPFTTSGPPERQRWVSTLTGEHLMTNSATPLDPTTEWGMVLHNRRAQEEGGALLLIDPQQVQAASAAGTYGVGVTLALKPDSRAAQVAMGYFIQEPYSQAVAACRREASQRLDHLRAVDWRAKLDLAPWQQDRKEIAELLADAGNDAALRAEAEDLTAEMDRAVTASEAGTVGADRQVVVLQAKAADLKSRLYEVALKGLLEAMNR